MGTVRILIAGSEMVPLVKSGGLGDVLGALPEALAKLGHEVIVCLPHYKVDSNKAISKKALGIEAEIKIGDRPMSYSAVEAKLPDQSVRTILITNDELFGRRGLYVDPQTGKDFKDNDVRFSFFCRAIIDLVQKMNWRPDIVHVHDWQTSLAPVYLKTQEKDNSLFDGTKIVLTIHNMAYQGKFPKDRYHLLGLPEELLYATAPMEFFGETNFLKGGISFADKITTVSETYAREIQGAMGCGLEGVLRNRVKDISGILNGVDYSVWSPATDKKIWARYKITNLSGKKINKLKLLKEAGLPFSDKVPLVGMVSRLVEQKGLNLVIESAVKVFEENVRLLVLGTGGQKIEKELKKLERKFPDKVKVFLYFDDVLAHKIEAGSDLYLMPSLFEPCGLNQMYSLKYGTPPIVHAVGGLADTVTDYDEKSGSGTGLVFKKFTAEAMIEALKRALSLYAKKREWTKLMKNGMKQDFSWKRSAQKYSDLFEALGHGRN